MAPGPTRKFGLAPATSPDVHTIRFNETPLRQRRRYPLGTGNGADVQDVHGIYSFKRPTFCLHHEEVDNKEEYNKLCRKDEAVKVVDMIGDQGREKGDEKVEHPIGSLESISYWHAAGSD